MPAVATLVPHNDPATREGVSPAEAWRGPVLTWSGSTAAGGRARCFPLLGAIRNAVSTHVAALPVPYRTTTHSRAFSRCAIRNSRSPRRALVPHGARAVHLHAVRDRGLHSS